MFYYPYIAKAMIANLIFMKTAFYDMSDIQSGLIPDGINLSGKPAGGSYEAARLCETIKVSVEDISPTPRGEIFTIPVRFVAEPSMEAPI